MTIITRNQEQLAPSFQQVMLVRPSSTSLGSPYDGLFLNLTDRSNNAPYFDYVVTTDAESYTNQSSTVLDVSEWPLVKRASGYTANVGTIILQKRGCSITKYFDIGDQGIGSVTVLGNSVLPGTLLTYLHNLTFGAASVTGKDEYYYRTVTGQTPVAVTGANYLSVEPNTNCWAAGWDFSGVPIWNSNTNSPAKNGALLHPRILVEAEHYPRPVGTIFKFMDRFGNVFSTTSIGVCKVPTMATNDLQTQANELRGDIRIHFLSVALPDTVATYPVVGSWAYATGLDGAGTVIYPWKKRIMLRNPLSCLFLDQTRKAKFLGAYTQDCKTETDELIAAAFGDETFSLPYCGCALQYPVGDLKDIVEATGRHSIGISGDSGSGLMTPLDANSLAIAFCFTSPVSGSSLNETRVNVLIASAIADAISRGHADPGVVTVTVAPDPTA